MMCMCMCVGLCIGQDLEKKTDLSDGNKAINEDPAWTTGIVEVALPAKYKATNIEATELARQKLIETNLQKNQLKAILSKQKTLSVGSGSVRFQKDGYEKEKKRLEKMSRITSHAKNMYNSGEISEKPLERSTDTYFLNKFIKNSKNFKRK